jgi:hypothetical protein
MGWTGTYRDPKMSALGFFRRILAETEILDAGEDDEGTVYLAVRRPDDKVYCLICLTEWEDDPYFNFNYKVMGESEGPFAAKCPENVFKLLSPPEKLYTGMMLERSRKWRENVRHQKLW